MLGTDGQNIKSNHKLFAGNRPTNTILIDKLNPKSLGSLIAMYEHKILPLELYGIFSVLIQFGVELGKKLAKNILTDIANKDFDGHDSSTNNLLKKYQSTD